MLWDRYGPNYLSLSLAGNLNLVFTEFRLEGHVHGESLSAGGDLHGFENAFAKADLEVHVGVGFKLRRVSLFIRFQLNINDRDLDTVFWVRFTHLYLFELK